MSPPNNAYPYRAYIETLLNYGPAAKASHLTTWIIDIAGEMYGVPGSEQNAALLKRQDYTKNSKTGDLIGHLHCDVFNQDKLLLNGVEVHLRLVRSKDAFCPMDASNINYSAHITEATLLVHRVKVNPTVLVAHSKTLASTTEKYPITRVKVKYFTINSGINGHCLENIILGQLPKRVVHAFVDNKTFNGDRKLNPFNFLSLYVDGAQIPSKPLQTSFTGKSLQFIEVYHTLFSGTGIFYANEGNTISRDEYANGYCLFAFDLTPDISAQFARHWNLVKKGTMIIRSTV